MRRQLHASGHGGNPAAGVPPAAPAVSGAPRQTARDRRAILRRVAGRLALVLALGAVGVSGYWGLAGRTGEEGEPASVGDVINIPGGQLRVEAVLPESGVDHAAMAGLTMPEAAPAGSRRFAVQLTLLGGEGRGVDFAPGSFSIDGPGMDRATPLRSTGEPITVDGGMRLSVSILFEAPESVTELRLRFKNQGPGVRLVLTEPSHGHGE